MEVSGLLHFKSMAAFRGSGRPSYHPRTHAIRRKNFMLKLSRCEQWSIPERDERDDGGLQAIDDHFVGSEGQ